MTEETITKSILNWLIKNDWKIVCFDFPQSGTGRVLHPNASTEKNKNSIIPDIVAVKEHDCVFFENKSYYYHPDFEKVYALKSKNEYSESIEKLLKAYNISNIYYGIGYPKTAHTDRSVADMALVDFLIVVNESLEIDVVKKPDSLSF